MSVKLIIEIQPEGERCGECRCQYPFEGEFECGAFDAQLKRDAEFGDRFRLPACIAAQAAAKEVSREDMMALVSEIMEPYDARLGWQIVEAWLRTHGISVERKQE